jgi:hypothetical protein
MAEEPPVQKDVTLKGVQDVSGLISAGNQGDEKALNDLVAVVYPELRQIARHQLRRSFPVRPSEPHTSRRGWLKHGNPPGDFLTAPRCGAKARTQGGRPCQAPAVREHGADHARGTGAPPGDAHHERQVLHADTGL